jgi:hypothetical protein
MIRFRYIIVNTLHKGDNDDDDDDDDDDNNNNNKPFQAHISRQRRPDNKIVGISITFLNVALWFIITIQLLFLFPAVLLAVSIVSLPQLFCTSPLIL